MKATIKDIAKAANISYSSVSRALNGLKGVSEQTRELVFRIAEEMEYSPNAVARGLVQKQTATLGLILPDITNPFYPELVRGVEERASAAGYNTFFCNTNYDLKREESYIRDLLEKRVDGLILSPITSHTYWLEERNHIPVPFVYLGNAPSSTKYNYVIMDNKRGGYLAARTLIERKYRTIGFISGVQNGSITDGRYSGYIEAMKQYGVAIDERFIIQESWRQESGYAALHRMAENGSLPEAVIAGNDLIAMGVMQAARERNIRIPQELAIIGFDDIPNAAWPEVNLSTIRQPKLQMGAAAVEILIELIAEAGEETATPHLRRMILDPELVIRGSC